TPVASGSSVPRWPIWRKPAARRTASTTSCDVRPVGLSITRAPSTGGGCGVRGMGFFQSFGITADGKPARKSGAFFFHLVQQVLDVLPVFHRLVEMEENLGSAAELEPLHQFVTDESRGRGQSLESGSPLRFFSRHVHKHPRTPPPP